MSHCPYCRRELTAFDTICKECYEAGYDRVTHPKPWWKPSWSFRQPRFTLSCLYVFLFTFGYFFVDFRFFWHSSNNRAVLAASAIALVMAVIESITEDGNPNRKTKKTPE